MNVFLNQKKPASVSDITKKLEMTARGQAIAWRLMKVLLDAGFAIEYEEKDLPKKERKKIRRKLYGPTPMGIASLFLFRQTQPAEMKNIRKDVKKNFGRFEDIFDSWFVFPTFQKQAKIFFGLEKSVEDPESELKNMTKIFKEQIMEVLEVWIALQTEFNNTKLNIPQKYQILIGAEMLEKNNPEYVKDHKKAIEKIKGGGYE